MNITVDGTTIGNKIVETMYSNRVTSENQKSTPLRPPLNVGGVCCFLQVARIAAQHEGEGGGKALFSPYGDPQKNGPLE